MSAIWNSAILDPMVNALLFIYGSLGENFGLAIIVFTALIRLITLPLTYQQQVSTQKMQELQKSPKFLKIKKKYEKDRTKFQEEQMKLYREEGVNPLAGCFPMLIQFPIIIGLYQAIIRALGDAPLQLYELSQRIYSFIPSDLIPLNSRFLWMDLGQPERLIIPGIPIGIPVLTVLVVITTYFQTKLTTPAASPDAGQGTQQMTQMMGLYMPLLLGYFAYTFSAGLALYFVASNVLAIVQYAALGKVNWRELFRRSPQTA